ncbi:hypothetical protein T440DRAFT_465057 [Plenodomus tracheiphilus IPT5]|uniref:PXA domain-containing protein n=1 Tax=Plenodomus tracheiphilus IPT5 TaxID=1408161 RepID=A0A6A7BEW8_9PLEO|nr:hypothetical protein T440DRAFT_465057 [Plenodomus tracheiphilus IPT5]
MYRDNTALYDDGKATMTESTHHKPDVSLSQPHNSQTTSWNTAEIIDSDLPNRSRSTGTSRQSEAQKTVSDTISDKVTSAFVRRTLCSHDVLLGNGEKGHTTLRPIEEVLPPLTSSNEVDLQLYAIISVIIRDFVHAWYSKITPDQVFVSEVILIIAHCTRALEQRLQEVDLEALLLDEIPELVHAHLSSYRLAKAQAKSTGTLVSNPRVVYHTLHPHPALSPVPNDDVPGSIVEQRESESAWRQLLVQGLLAVLLPTEDLENGCLRALVAEMFAEMIFANGISGKACESWLLWECITKLAEIAHTDESKEVHRPVDENSEQPLTRLERFGLLAARKEQKEFSGRPLAATGQGHHKVMLVSIPDLFWITIQYAFWAFTAVRVVVLSLVNARSLPSRFHACEQSLDGARSQSQVPHVDPTMTGRTSRIKRPILSMKLWSCAARLADLDVRMPWLLGFISMLHNRAMIGPGKVGETDGVLDRFLSHILHVQVFNPALVPVILRTLRATLFPNNALGPPRLIPSEEEARAIKSRCAASLLALLPKKVAAAYFTTSDREVHLQHIEEFLDSFEDVYLNKHLIYQLVELIVLRLAPELGLRGVQELFEERMS